MAVGQQAAASGRLQRADAARNRERLLVAAAEVFHERGLEAGVGEIAERAGLGRATLFRNFPTKQALMTALLAQEMRGSLERGRALLAESGDEGGLMRYLGSFVAMQQANRGLLEAVAEDAFMQDPEIAVMRDEVMVLIDEMIARDQRLGLVRDGLTASDVMLLMKGVCAVACSPMGHEPHSVERHLELIGHAIAARTASAPTP